MLAGTGCHNVCGYKALNHPLAREGRAVVRAGLQLGQHRPGMLLAVQELGPLELLERHPGADLLMPGAGGTCQSGARKL